MVGVKCIGQADRNGFRPHGRRGPLNGLHAAWVVPRAQQEVHGDQDKDARQIVLE